MKVSQQKINIALVATYAVMMSACSSTHRADVEQTKRESETANNSIAVKNDASYYTELSFSKGSTQLDATDKAALRNLVSKSMENGEVDEIKIITWADKSYPSKQNKSLSSAQRKLAEKRNDRIKDYLKDVYPSLDVSVYNMAARPNILQNLFNTADAKTKRTFEEAGVSGGEAQKNSKSLVMSIVKGKQ